MAKSAAPEAIAAPTSAVTRRSASDLAVAVVLFVAALGWFSLTLDRTFEPRDEGHLLRLSAQVAEGAVPHRDFIDVYAPATFGVTGAVMRVFGQEMLPVRIFLAALKALAVAAGYLLSRRFASRPFALAAALLAIGFWGRSIWNLNAPYAALYTLALTPLALVALVAAEARRSTAGLVAAGVLAGATLLFKHSLAAFLVYGMALALWASAMLPGAPGSGTRRETRITLGAWGLAGALPLLPVLSFLTLSDYALHVLPIHVLMAGVAHAAWRRGGTVPLSSIIATRLLPFACGVAILPLVTLGLYAGWGATHALFDDLFVLPLTLEGYRLPVSLPAPGAVLTGSGAVAAVVAGWLAIVGRKNAALGPALFAGVALLWLLVQPGPWYALLLEAPRELRGLQPVLLAWMGIAALMALRSHALPRAARAAWLAAVFLQAFLGFQAFPRAAYGIYLAQGLQGMLLAGLLSTWHARIREVVPSRAAHAGAAALLLAVPMWLVAPAVLGVLEARATPEAFRALRFPQASGIKAPRATVERRGIPDMERVAAWLAAKPGPAPVLLLGNDEMILFSSGREPLLPRLRAHLFWIGWGIGSSHGRADLEAELLRRLEAEPAALVVDAEDGPSRRLRAAFPHLSARLDRHYHTLEQVGRFRILERGPLPGE